MPGNPTANTNDFTSYILPLLISGIGTAGGALANKPQVTSFTQNASQTLTPNYDIASQGFRDQILGEYLKQLQGNGPGLAGYEASGIQNINRTRDLQSQASLENLAYRGVAGPALGFALNNINNQRFSDIAGFRNQLPLLQNQLKSQILQNAGGFFSTIPHGTTGTQTSSGTQVGQGNQVAGGLGSLATTLAYLYGQGAFRPPVT